MKIFIFFFFLFSAELKMDVLREREMKDSLERQLMDEQKTRGKLLLSLFFLGLSGYILLKQRNYSEIKNTEGKFK